MKKILLTAACLFLASQASAKTLTGITMDWYDASNPRQYVGYSTSVTGAIDTTARTGHLVGDVPFFGASWQADVVWASESAGANTWGGIGGPVWDGTGYNNVPFSYNFNLAAGDVAVGLLWDWAPAGSGIPVLAVFRPDWLCACLPGEECTDDSKHMTWVDQVWYTGTSTTPHQGMQTYPFPGQLPAFSGYAVPEPASMLLIGSGLAGLVGVARRRR